MANEALRGIGRGTQLMLLGSGVAALANFATAVVVARLLSQEDAGIFFAGIALFALVYGVTRLAAGVGLVKLVASDRAVGRYDRTLGFLKAALIPVLALSCTAGILVALLADWLAASVLDTDLDNWWTLALWGALIPFAAVSDVLVSATRAFGVFGPAVVVDKVARPILQLVLVSAAAVMGLDPVHVVTAWALPYLLSGIWIAGWTKRLRSRDGIPPEESPIPWREFWGFTWARSAGVLIQVALQRLDILLLTAIRGPVEAALYAAATRFLVLGQLIGQSFSLSLQPQIAVHVARGEDEEVRELFEKSTAWLVLTSWPLYAAMLVFGPVLMSVFGADYSSGAQVLAILAVAMLVATGVGPVDQMLIMMGKPSWVLVNSILSLAVNVAVNLWLIPVLGASGAAVAWAASILVANVVPLAQLYRWRRLSPFGGTWLTAVLLTGACFLLWPLVVRLFLGATLATALVAASVAAVAFLVGLRLLAVRLDLRHSPLSFVAAGQGRTRSRNSRSG